MKTEHFSLTSRQDGLPLDVLLTLPDDPGTLSGIVQISHGMCEHKERYLPFMEFLAARGYGAVIHDHRDTDSRRWSPAPWDFSGTKTERPLSKTFTRLPAASGPGSKMCPSHCWDIPWDRSWPASI